MPEQNKVTVHILRAGRPMCHFTECTPNNWPEGHLFVTPRSAFDPDFKDVNCPKCKEALLNR